MKAVILAGGAGTRLAEETEVRPKPMVEIGEQPILWHIMKIYAAYGVRDFIVCLGYKGHVIKEFFHNCFLRHSSVTIDLSTQHRTIHQSQPVPWRVTLVDTGKETSTGGRIKRIREHLDGDETFLMTYGDGVASVNIAETIRFHQKHGRMATVTAVRPLGRFGILRISEDGMVTGFQEKPPGDGNWINGGFFVLSTKVLDHIAGDHVVWEREVMEWLSSAGELVAYHHHGFWRPMDTLRDKHYLQELWDRGNPPWVVTP